MKKLIALLLTLSTLFAASCAAVKTGDDGTTETRKAPDEQTTVGEETTDGQTTADDITTVEDPGLPPSESYGKINGFAHYLSLFGSDAGVKATCLTTDPEQKTCTFSVDEVIYKECEINGTITLKDTSAFAVGKQYYLFLKIYFDKYMPEPEFIFDDFFPIETGKGFLSSLNAAYYMKEDKLISAVKDENDFLKAIKDTLVSQEYLDLKAAEVKVEFIQSDALADIVKGSATIVHLKIGEQNTGYKVRYRKEVYCTVVESLKGKLNVGDSIKVIVALSDNLEAGDEAILLLTGGDSFYTYSSRHSVRPLEEKDEIKALIANN